MRILNKVLEPLMEVRNIGRKPVYGVKSGILQHLTSETRKDGSWIPLAIKLILTPGSGNHLFPTTLAAEEGGA